MKHFANFISFTYTRSSKLTQLNLSMLLQVIHLCSLRISNSKQLECTEDIDMDLIRLQDQELKLNPATQLSAVQKKQTACGSIIFGMSVTDARKATFDFSDSYHAAVFSEYKDQVLLL